MLAKIRGVLEILCPFLYLLLLIGVLFLLFGTFLQTFSTQTAFLVLEYLKALIWPAVVIFVLIKFRSNIVALFNRVKEFDSPAGQVTFELPPAQDEPMSPEGPTDLPETAEIEEVLEEKVAEVAELSQDKASLIKRLGQAQLEVEFERIYRNIYGSQIQLLQYAHTYPEVDFAVVSDHFEKVKKLYAPTFDSLTATMYLTFLDSNGLTAYISSGIAGEQPRISITPKGKAFLEYLGARNYQKQNYY